MAETYMFKSVHFLQGVGYKLRFGAFSSSNDNIGSELGDKDFNGAGRLPGQVRDDHLYNRRIISAPRTWKRALSIGLI